MDANRRKLLHALVGFAGLSGAGLLAACTPKVQKTFALGMVEFPGYAPWYLAKRKEFFGHTDVSLQRIPHIGDIRSAFMSGKLDGYVATFDIFQTIKSQLPPGKLVLPLVSSNGADGVVSAANVRSVADLKGKAVAGEVGLPPVFILEYLLHKQQMSLADVQFADIPSDQAAGAFLTGKYSAVGTYQPFIDRSIEQVSNSKILATSKELPGLITDFLITSNEMLDGKLTMLADIAHGWYQSVSYIDSNPNDAMAIMASEFSIKTNEMRDYGKNIKWLTLEDGLEMMDISTPRNAYKLFDEVNEVLRANDHAISLASSREFIDTRLLNRLNSEK